jgi:hypothetical protein
MGAIDCIQGDYRVLVRKFIKTNGLRFQINIFYNFETFKKSLE